jgi:hypothetical protein|tara:strand:- start:245 stop:604 length:360 start_codon:yes stop_codon:yes gene_type:complete
MKHIFKIIALVVITLIVGLITVVSKAQAGGPWSDQYCDVEITKIKIVDAQGNVIEERTEEKLVCNDGAKDFLHGMGIADSCQMFTWMMPLQGTVIKQRDIACHKMNGEYEIVQGYHSID